MSYISNSELQYAGEYLLEECRIISVTGKEYDIKDLVEEVNVYEDIEDAAISGSIIVSDTTNIVMNLPIIGEERLILKLSTPQSSPTEETIIDYTLNPLMIYKINRQQGIGENEQMVSMEFTTPETLRNQSTRVSQSYSGDTSEIIEKILRDETYLNSKKNFYKEPTANMAKVVFPNLHPYRCITQLLQMSNSKDNGDSPAYLFYESTKGFHLRTFDGLCNDPVQFDYRDNVATRLTPQGTTDPIANLETIGNYEVVATKNSISSVGNGMLSSKLIQHDIYNKKINTHKYNYLENYDRDIHPDNGESNPIVSEAPDPDTNKNLSQYEDTRVFVTTTASGYSFSEDSNYPYQSDNLERTLQRRVGRREQFGGGIILNLEVPGNTMIKIGDKISVELGASSTLSDKKDDDNLSGNYIIMRLRHIFTQSQEYKHKIVMTVAKDSKRGLPYPASGVSQTNYFGKSKGLSRTIVT